MIRKITAMLFVFCLGIGISLGISVANAQAGSTVPSTETRPTTETVAAPAVTAAATQKFDAITATLAFMDRLQGEARAAGLFVPHLPPALGGLGQIGRASCRERVSSPV